MVTGSPPAIWLWYHPLLWWLPPIAQRSKTLGKVERIRFLAFEEGYLRPQFITVEEGGVNAYSSLPRDPDFYRKLPDMPAPHVENLKPSTMKRIGHAMWYYLMGWHYRHEFLATATTNHFPTVWSTLLGSCVLAQATLQGNTAQGIAEVNEWAGSALLSCRFAGV